VKKIFIFISSLSFFLPLAKAIELPKNLDKAERKEVIEILGLSTSSKLISDPFPLGGYLGLEISLSVEEVDVLDLNSLGDTVDGDSKLLLPRLSIGKGVYNDVDVFFHFTPYSEDTGISDYGGMLRWCLFQAETVPITLSLLTHYSQINVEDAFTNQTIGVEGLLGINVNQVALYFGGGKLEGRSQFIDGGAPISEKSSTTHSFVGVSLRLLPFFVAFQFDHYKNPIYGIRTGLRF
jgi:hypothetical protein